MLNHPYRSNLLPAPMTKSEKTTATAKFAVMVTVLCVAIGFGLKYLGIIRVLAILWQMVTWLIGGFVGILLMLIVSSLAGSADTTISKNSPQKKSIDFETIRKKL